MARLMQRSDGLVILFRRSHALIPLVAAFVLLGLLLALMLQERSFRAEEVFTVEVAGPEVVIRHRESFRAGVEALARHDPAEAVLTLESFSFGDRAVEPYRLYLLANAYSLAGDLARARTILERAWRRNKVMVASTDIAFHLLGLYQNGNDWSRAAVLTGELMEANGRGVVGAAARREHMIASFYAGDPGEVYRTALRLAIRNAESPSAEGTVDLVTALRGREKGGGLDPGERLIRAEQLMAQRRSSDAFDLAGRIDPDSLGSSQRGRLSLLKGQALSRLGRHKESEEILEPLFSGRYRHAIPALEASARNRRLMAEAPITGRLSASDRSKREAEAKRHRALYLERLRDLLSLPIGRELKVIVIERLIDDAEENEQIDRMKRLISVLATVDPSTDRGLQIMWDQGWLAYEKQNDPIAIDRFDFIVETYRNPAIKRQARYWLAKSLARSGRTERAKEIFRDLAAVAYKDLYAQFAENQLGISEESSGPQALPLSTAEDWSVLAEREMPRELRLAWELTLLGEFSEAREEIRRHRSDSNDRYANALLGETFHAAGAWQIANRYLKSAFPEIATAEQSVVPLHFLKMYHVLPFEEEILHHSRKRNLDPALIAALVHQETTFNARAVSPAGAKGLMQLMPATAREIGQKLHLAYGEDHLFEPAFNIDLGTYYVDQLLRLMDGDVELTVAGYNGGPFRIRQWRRASKKPKDEFLEGMALSETRNYVKRVMILRSSYRTLYPSLRASG